MEEIRPGDQVRYLTVLEEATASDRFPRQKMWKCRCVCGNECVMPEAYLIQGTVSSCGCRHWPVADYTGKRYNHLIGIRPTEKRKNQAVVWEWRCDCGNTVEALPKTVVSGKRKSCGCIGRKVKAQNGKKALDAIPVADGTNLALIASTKLYKSNTSGCRGVHWNKRQKKWVATIGFQGRHIFLGYFADLEDAITARKKAEQEYFAPMLTKHKDIAKKR